MAKSYSISFARTISILFLLNPREKPPAPQNKSIQLKFFINLNYYIIGFFSSNLNYDEIEFVPGATEQNQKVVE